jgi:hypothetical protein
LEYIPHPGPALRSLSALLRPGGLMVFQDACWGPLLQLSAHLPLRSRCASLIYRAFELSGAHVNMELVLYRAIQESGLPVPNMRIEVPFGKEPSIVHWVYDIFCACPLTNSKTKKLAISKHLNRGSRPSGWRRIHSAPAWASLAHGRGSRNSAF